jgi:methionyl-tRNA synthetase
MEMEHIFITTAISYTNGSPHIGHLYEAILADFIKRVYQIRGYEVKLLTGTDEHGKKIQTTAQEQNLTPIQLCDKYSLQFKEMNKKINSSYDYFIRTTEPTHKEHVSKTIDNIISIQSEDNPIIYLGEYSGYYNMREECYITQIQASQTNYIDPISSKPYEILKEPSYFLKLDKYEKEINKCVEKIIPSHFIPEIKSRLSKGLEDLSITRTGIDWGIPFPTNNSHTIYVWFDALLNYITGQNILYGLNGLNDNKKVKSIHLIGKDIIWFHSVIYPAILEASYPQHDYNKYIDKILVHGFILDKEGRKMSKSMGNVISNDELLKTYPIEAIRYYLITNTILGQDFKFDSYNLVNMYNNILIKNFGNLFQRLLKVIKPLQIEINQYLELNKTILEINKVKCNDMLDKFICEMNFYLYHDYLNQLINISNKDLTEKKPWTLEIEEQVEILSHMVVDFYLIMCLMYPIIPSKVLDLGTHFGWNKFDLKIEQINLSIYENSNKIIAFEYIKTIAPKKIKVQ